MFPELIQYSGIGTEGTAPDGQAKDAMCGALKLRRVSALLLTLSKDQVCSKMRVHFVVFLLAPVQTSPSTFCGKTTGLLSSRFP